MIDDNEIDIISIASFDNNHFSQIERALNNGKIYFVKNQFVVVMIVEKIEKFY